MVVTIFYKFKFLNPMQRQGRPVRQARREAEERRRLSRINSS